jgi:hypothetical protein
MYKMGVSTNVMLMAFSGLQAYSSQKRQMRELGAQQAAGQRFIEVGAELERSELSMRMEAELLASTEQAVSNSEQLRQVLASQNVLAAARGQSPGAGVYRTAMTTAVRAHSEDEKARKLSLNFSKFNIENQKQISRLNQGSASYGLFSNTARQQGVVRDTFKEKMIDLAGGAINAATAIAAPGMKAPVTKSKGVDVGTYKKGR